MQAEAGRPDPCLGVLPAHYESVRVGDVYAWRSLVYPLDYVRAPSYCSHRVIVLRKYAHYTGADGMQLRM